MGSIAQVDLKNVDITEKFISVITFKNKLMHTFIIQSGVFSI